MQMSEAQKWRRVVDNSLKWLSVGLLCGGATSFVLFRSVVSRVSITAFGAGCGIGKSYVDTKYMLGHYVTESPQQWVASVLPAADVSVKA